MKAARLHRYDESIPQESLNVEEIDEPKIEDPFDVIVRVGPPGSAAPTSTSSKASGHRSKILMAPCCPTCPATKTPVGLRRWAPV